MSLSSCWQIGSAISQANSTVVRNACNSSVVSDVRLIEDRPGFTFRKTLHRPLFSSGVISILKLRLNKFRTTSACVL